MKSIYPNNTALENNKYKWIKTTNGELYIHELITDWKKYYKSYISYIYKAIICFLKNKTRDRSANFERWMKLIHPIHIYAPGNGRKMLQLINYDYKKLGHTIYPDNNAIETNNYKYIQLDEGARLLNLTQVINTACECSDTYEARIHNICKIFQFAHEAYQQNGVTSDKFNFNEFKKLERKKDGRLKPMNKEEGTNFDKVRKLPDKPTELCISHNVYVASRYPHFKTQSIPTINVADILTIVSSVVQP